MHFYGWKLGLKTGQYYLRTKAAVEAIKFTVDSTASKKESTTASTAAGAGGSQQSIVRDPREQADLLSKIKAEQEAKSKYECVGCGS